jgi:starch-binding outer membrane protein, SusD/RagB family
MRPSILKHPQIRIVGLCFSLFLISASCKKDWLDAKPDKSLVVPKYIKDYQALLDNHTATATSSGQIPFNVAQPGYDEVGAGDFVVADVNVGSGGSNAPFLKNTYQWVPDIFMGSDGSIEWNYPYARIFVTNIILEGIEKIIPADQNEQIAWNRVKGSALFFRAYSHYNIASLFCKPYDKGTAGVDLGIPIKLTSDINEKTFRPTVQQTYDQILKDLKLAAELLPDVVPSNTNSANIDGLSRCRPNKAAANAMLARVCLSMSEYESAFEHANKSLLLYDTLMNYDKNTNVNKTNTATTTIPKYNPEVLFQMTLNNYTYYSTVGEMDSTLRNLYAANDWRQVVFIKPPPGSPAYTFRGSYDGSATSRFSGLATDEIYLIRAECYARKENKTAAMTDLNKLLRNRKKGNPTDTTAVNSEDALRQILVERRKELCFRGIRWTDLRRLNKDPRFAVTLKRLSEGQMRTLPPEDPRYVLPIPNNVIRLSGIQQNPR